MRSLTPTCQLLVLLLFSGCIDRPIPPPGGGILDDNGANRAPVLAPVGAVQSEEGDRIRIVLAAHDPDLDLVTYSVDPLPEGAVFDTEWGVFEWIPPAGSAGQSPFRLIFGASDGVLTSTTPATLHIGEATFAIARAFPNRVPAQPDVRITVEGVGFQDGAVVRVAGLPTTDVVVHDDRRLQFTAPDLSAHFGPQAISVALTNGRTATLSNAFFVFRENAQAFGSARHLALESEATDFALGDFDGDGDDDVVAASTDGLVVHNDSDDRVVVVSTTGVHQVIVGRYDQDDVDDIAFLNEEGEVRVSLSSLSTDQSRTRDHVVLADADDDIRFISSFDVEPDGDDELLLIDVHGSGWVHYPIRNHEFAGPEESISLGLPNHIEFADVDGDDVLDALLSFDGAVGVATGVETGTFFAFELIADAEGLDNLTAEYTEAGTILAAAGENEVSYFTHNGDRWRLDHKIPLPTYPDFATTGLLDVSGDGVAELLGYLPVGGVGIFEEERGQMSHLGWRMTGAVLDPPEWGDLDGDGVSELNFLTTDRLFVVSLPVSSDGVVGGPEGLFTEGGSALAARDNTYDGGKDLIIFDAAVDGSRANLQYRGGGGFDGDAAFLPTRSDWVYSVVGDLTGDGYGDVLGGPGDTTLECFPSKFTVAFDPAVQVELERAPIELAFMRRSYFEGVVLARFDDGEIYRVSFGPLCERAGYSRLVSSSSSLFISDLNGDDWDEVIIVQEDGAALYGDDYGMLVELGVIPLGELVPIAVAGGDLDADGVTDMVIATEDGIFAMFDLSTDGSWELIDPGPGSSVATGDLNGDGRYEIAIGDEIGGLRLLSPDDEGYSAEPAPPWHTAGSSPVFVDLDGDFDEELVTLEHGFGPIVWWNQPITESSEEIIEEIE